MIEENGDAAEWDVHAVKLTLAYNLSPQETTNLAPFHLLYAREPLFPSKAAPPFLETLADQDWVSSLAARVEYLEDSMPTIANHLAIAKHRDTLRYAYTRTGAFRPQNQRFTVGDYVYIRRPTDSKTQLKATPIILQVTRLTPTGTVELMGRCGQVARTHVRNIAPCHLPHIDRRILPSLRTPEADQACEVCGLPNRPSKMLICDGCSAGYHLDCLTPPLTTVPAEDWFCPVCISEGLCEQAPTARDRQQHEQTKAAAKAHRALYKKSAKGPPSAATANSAPQQGASARAARAAARAAQPRPG